MTLGELLADNAALSGRVQRSAEALKIALLTIDKMKVELTYLRRMKYGRSSEKLEHAQLELVGGQVAQPVVVVAENAGISEQDNSNVTSIEAGRKKRQSRLRPGLRELPEHLPRRTVVHAPQDGCSCEACGGGLREIGQDVSEVLDYEPGSFHVVRKRSSQDGLWRLQHESLRHWRRTALPCLGLVGQGCFTYALQPRSTHESVSVPGVRSV